MWATTDFSWVLSQGICEFLETRSTRHFFFFPQVHFPVLSTDLVFSKQLLIDSVPCWERAFQSKPDDWFLSWLLTYTSSFVPSQSSVSRRLSKYWHWLYNLEDSRFQGKSGGHFSLPWGELFYFYCLESLRNHHKKVKHITIIWGAQIKNINEQIWPNITWVKTGNQKRTCGSWFSHSTMCVTEMEFR